MWLPSGEKLGASDDLMLRYCCIVYCWEKTGAQTRRNNSVNSARRFLRYLFMTDPKMLLFPYFVRFCEPICNLAVEFVDGSDLKVIYKTARAELVDSLEGHFQKALSVIGRPPVAAAAYELWSVTMRQPSRNFRQSSVNFPFGLSFARASDQLPRTKAESFEMTVISRSLKVSLPIFSLVP